MLDERLLKSAKDLLNAMDEVTDKNMPSEIAEIVKFHSKGAAASAIASGWVPGVGSTIAVTISAGFIWTMYGRINKKLNIPIKENILKSLATGVATNFASYAVGSLVISGTLSLIPGLGSVGATVIVGATCYALTLTSGFLYIKGLTQIFKQGEDPTKFDADSFKDFFSKISDKKELKEIMKEAKDSYKENAESNSVDSNFLSEEEKKYIEEINFMLEDDGVIDEKERVMLDKFRRKFGIDEERANQLESYILSKSNLTKEEKEYIEEFKNIISDGEVSEKERRILSRLANILDISEDRARELEKMV